MRRAIPLFVWALASCQGTTPPPEPTITAVAPSSPTAWATVTAPADAALLTALGVVRGVGAAAGATVTAPFDGRVRALHVAPGDTVRAGAPLVDVDVPELAVAAAAALGAEGEASVHTERLDALRGLLEDGLVRAEQLHESEHLLAEVNTRRRVAMAKLRAAGLDHRAAAEVARRGYITLTSPIDGTVIAVDARLGAAAGAAAPLVRVVGEGEVRVEARLPRPFDGAASLRTPHGDVALRPLGRAVRDPLSGLWIAFFAPADASAELRDGETHPLSLEGIDDGGALEVPASALRIREDVGAPANAAEVERRRDGATAWVGVAVVRVNGASAIVRSPELRAGDAVAVDPAEVLREGEEGAHGH
jgi:multidrug efflux pump subunit AcrA (membrane-fusion protein)